MPDCADHRRRDRAEGRGAEQRSDDLGWFAELFVVSLAATVPGLRRSSKQSFCPPSANLCCRLYFLSPRGAADVAAAFAKARRDNRSSRRRRRLNPPFQGLTSHSERFDADSRNYVLKYV